MMLFKDITTTSRSYQLLHQPFRVLERLFLATAPPSQEIVRHSRVDESLEALFAQEVFLSNLDELTMVPDDKRRAEKKVRVCNSA